MHLQGLLQYLAEWPNISHQPDPCGAQMRPGNRIYLDNNTAKRVELGCISYYIYRE